jgi:hypothetical protein
VLAQKEEQDIEIKYQNIKAGLEFLLRHFGTGRHWPRKIQTAATNDRRQYTASSVFHAMTYFRGALGQDCRINIFALEQTNPNCILIDLDDNNALAETLSTIDKKIGGTPSVYHTGRGYHILQPIKCDIALETIPELTELESEPSNKFLQFAKRYLSNGKADPAHNPALKSCLTRIPNSINSKNGNEVKIIQEWDGYRPYYRQLYDAFYDELKRKKQFQRQKHQARNNNNKYSYSIGTYAVPQNYYPYIEKLLETSIEDNRKLVVGLILSRYLINIKRLEYEKAYDEIWQWLDKCSQLRRLEPSASYFDRYVVQYQLERAKDNGMPPMSENRLRSDYPGLYEVLKLSNSEEDS